MDVDSSQYAAMAMEMVQNNSYLEITDQGRNYLDKPPLLFWLSAFSYQLFGMSNAAFKLPSMLFALLGILSTYKLAKLYYDEKVSYWAALIVGSTQAFFLMVNDVRTDLMLTGAVIFAVWQIAEYIEKKKWLNFILGFIGIGLAMLAKGPIGLVLPAMALGIHLVLQRDWRTIFKWQWLLGLVIVGIVLLPMMIGLYTQYDSNPLVKVNGKVGESGLKFYFWTQSFGRITGENVWDNNAGPLFLTESTLWAFLPWTILLFSAWIGGWFKIIKAKFKIEKGQEAITIGTFTFALLALSKSSYQLPHYIFVAYPFAAIFTAKWAICVLENGWQWAKNTIKITQVIISILIWGAIAGLFYVFAPSNILLPAILVVGLIMVLYYIAKNYSNTTAVLQVSFVSICFFNLAMNTHFYPKLLNYQAFSVGGKYINSKVADENINNENFIIFPMGAAHSLDFYTGWIVRSIWSEHYFSNFKNGDIVWVYTNEKGKERLKKHLPEYEIVEDKHMHFYKPAELRIEFLNPETRANTLKNHYILKVKIKQQEKVDFSKFLVQKKYN
jgi:4-amino-4-deoxy-L-arabinose transferase-like glycosyltransferase